MLLGVGKLMRGRYQGRDDGLTGAALMRSKASSVSFKPLLTIAEPLFAVGVG